MREDFRLAVIGAGRMGEALVGGFIASGLLEPSRIVVAEVDPGRGEAISERFGVRTTIDPAAAVSGAHGVLLAVKPQQVDDVARTLVAAMNDGVVVVSIAAGVTTSRLEGLLGPGRRVVRVMPNQAAVLGLAVSAVSGGASADDSAVKVAVELMSAVGTTVVLEERLMNASTALNGSGPAYVYLFAEALIEAGVRHGLEREQARTLVVETVRGAGEMLAHGGEPKELIDAVASPGGTTVAALEALREAGFTGALGAGVDAAVQRAEELG